MTSNPRYMANERGVLKNNIVVIITVLAMKTALKCTHLCIRIRLMFPAVQISRARLADSNRLPILAKALKYSIKLVLVNKYHNI